MAALLAVNAAPATAQSAKPATPPVPPQAKPAAPAPAAKTPRALAAESAAAVARTYSLGYDLCYVPRRQAEERFAAWKSAADAGDADGKFMVAMCQWYGIGVPRSAAPSYRALRELAEAKHAGAQALLGLLIWNGTDQAEPDPMLARPWLQRSSDAGNSMGRDALLDLKVRDLRAEGKFDDAHELLQKAIDGGSTLAMVWLWDLESFNPLAMRPLLPSESLKRIAAASDTGNVHAMVAELHFLELHGDRTKPNPRVQELLAKAHTCRSAWLYRQAYAMSVRGAFGLTDADADGFAKAWQAFADPFSRCLSAFESSDPKWKGVPANASLKAVETAVACGFGQAHAQLAAFYREGARGTRVDMKKCVKLVERGTRALDPDSINAFATSGRYGWDGPADEKRARTLYQFAANLGDAEAMNSIGLRLDNGRGVAQDVDLAFRYFIAAALKGNGNAIINIGRSYLGKRPNYKGGPEVGLQWLLTAIHFGHAEAADDLAFAHLQKGSPYYDPKAAVSTLQWGVDHGSGAAAIRLASVYGAGEFVPRDPARARATLKLGVQTGSLECLVISADDFMNGWYGPRNLIAARKLLEEAADKGHAGACRRLAQLLALAPDSSAADIRRARNYVRTAIDLGDVDAYEVLAWIERRSAADLRVGLRAFIESLVIGSAQGSEACTSLLVQIYTFGGDDPDSRSPDLPAGERVARGHLANAESDRVRSMLGLNLIEQKRFDEGRVELERAAANGYADAMNSIGVLYRFGKGVKQDDAVALEWYLKAAELGHEKAMVNISYFYEKALGGLTRDPEKAFEWLKKAFDASPDDGEINLLMAKYHADGIGTPTNDAKALEHALRSARAGHAGAQAWCRARNLKWD